jgi:hypothetical protein
VLLQKYAAELWARTARLLVGPSIGIVRGIAFYLAKYGINGAVYYDSDITLRLRIFI